ncbi:MAG: TRAP transporter small permease [Spirochaetales bacterium]|jgi:TRAP-type C4-dicarboxylate transport system permease small subunit|nr:TRAP transporter small permease [Spirochaetales bacterium]
MRTLEKCVGMIQTAVNALIGAVLALMMCVILLQTFTRYVVFYSLPWSEELSRYLFVAMVCLGINLGVTKNLMIRIDLIDSCLSARMKHFFEIGRLVIELFVSLMFFLSSFDLIRIGKFQTSAAMRIPMHLLYGILTAGFGLAIIAVLLKLLQTLKQNAV